MPSINRVDQALAALRERLLKLKSERGPAAAPAGREATASGPTRQLQRLALTGAVPAEQLRKALVRNLLLDALGTEIANDLSFHTVVDRVSGLMEEDAALKILLDRAIDELTHPQR